MIRNYKVFYFGLAGLVLAALVRHVGTLASVLDVSFPIAESLPSFGIFAGIAIVIVSLSLLPLEGLRSGETSRKGPSREFKRESLSEVAKHVERLAGEPKPDIPRLVDYTFFQAIAAGASDIHFDPSRRGFTVRFRIDGMMSDIAQIPAGLTGLISNRIKVLSNLVVYQGFLPQDGRLGGGKSDSGLSRDRPSEAGTDFRVAFMPTLHGERIVIRILGRSGSAFDFAELGMTEAQREMMSRFLSEPQGMIVLTGPTGSGKTTTIYAALRAIQDQALSVRSISTLEDPIEYEIRGINQSQVDEKKNFTFSRGLRALLRQDPDVILVGEIRDQETAAIAIQAGMTGHLIISTVHANSSAAAFSRLLEMGVAPYSLNSAVTAVIAQRLVRRLCTACRRSRPMNTAECELLGLNPGDAQFNVYESAGCSGCQGTGFQGRYALFEFLEVTETVRSLIAEGASADAVYARAKADGMLSLYEMGIEAVKSGITTPNEIARSVVRERR